VAEERSFIFDGKNCGDLFPYISETKQKEKEDKEKDKDKNEERRTKRSQ